MDSRELDRRKTLQVTSVVKPVGDNDEFEKQRTAAIAEVAKSKEVRLNVLYSMYSIFMYNYPLGIYLVTVSVFL